MIATTWIISKSIISFTKNKNSDTGEIDRLVVMVITIMFKGYKRFCKCLILFNLRYKQTVSKVKEVFEFKNF